MGLTQACFMPAQHTLLGQWAPPQERTRLSIVSYAGILSSLHYEILLKCVEYVSVGKDDSLYLNCLI